jgi:nucleotide-binding universal stress UspA family protein
MFNNVIVGIDDQSDSCDAIDLAKNLRADGGELTLVHVHHGETMPVHSSNPGLETAEHQRSLAVLAKAREQAGVEVSRLSIGSSSIGRGLHELAERQHADLLVMGSCHRGLVGRVFVNDDTQTALNGAPCAVAVAPTGYSSRATAVTEIGVGYDTSPESERALAIAREFASQRGAKLSAFEAISLPRSAFGAGVGLLDKSILTLVDQARQRIAALGDVEPHAAYGSAAEELTVYSASLDLLFIGSRGYGPIGRLMQGSTSLQLARTARCPLIVLTRAATTAEAVERVHAASLVHA